jgi:predicted cupin superfamily sugar epimerase
MTDADTVIAILGLEPHPEGGYYAETWMADAESGDRPTGSAIYYLLRPGENARWHRIDAVETWYYYAGDPLSLAIAPAAGDRTAIRHVLGPDLEAEQRPQFIVPAGDWQSASSLGGWTLVGCTVSPAFRFAGFELAPPGWEPGPA